MARVKMASRVCENGKIFLLDGEKNPGKMHSCLCYLLDYRHTRYAIKKLGSSHASRK